MSNWTNIDMQGRQEERDRHDSTLSNYATHQYLEQRFGEALTDFCEVCGHAKTKVNALGVRVCTFGGCGHEIIPWDEEEAA